MDWVLGRKLRCYVSQNTAHYLCQKINIFGPIAAIWGHDFELFIATEYQLNTCPVDKLENSIQNTWGTLSKKSLDERPSGNSSWGRTEHQTWSYPDNDQNWQDRGQSSSEWKRWSLGVSMFSEAIFDKEVSDIWVMRWTSNHEQSAFKEVWLYSFNMTAHTRFLCIEALTAGAQLIVQ